jgi:hypothetical protein
MSNLEERAKSIKYRDIKHLDMFTYEVTSQDPKNQKEVKYMVYKSSNIGWTCTCPAFIYCKDAEKPICKHIVRVKAMIEVSAKRQFKKAKKQIEKLV